MFLPGMENRWQCQQGRGVKRERVDDTHADHEWIFEPGKEADPGALDQPVLDDQVNLAVSSTLIENLKEIRLKFK